MAYVFHPPFIRIEALVWPKDDNGAHANNTIKITLLEVLMG